MPTVNTNRVKKKRYTIFVGLKDKDERLQKIQTKRIIQLVNLCCREYGLAFSCFVQNGGYIHERGDYVFENSLCIVFIEPDEKLIDEIGKDLCAFLNQESVMVTVDEIESYYISESLS